VTPYRFSPSADKRQDDIWQYSVEQRGEQQAISYFKALHQHLSKLASNKLLWHPLPNTFVVPDDLDIEVYFSHYKKHYIFFRKLSDGHIGIVTILHDSMDMPVRLSEDLSQIVVSAKHL